MDVHTLVVHCNHVYSHCAPFPNYFCSRITSHMTSSNGEVHTADVIRSQ